MICNMKLSESRRTVKVGSGCFRFSHFRAGSQKAQAVSRYFPRMLRKCKGIVGFREWRRRSQFEWYRECNPPVSKNTLGGCFFITPVIFPKERQKWIYADAG